MPSKNFGSCSILRMIRCDASKNVPSPLRVEEFLMRQFDPDRSRAVIVGVTDYAELPDLPAVANNVAGLTEVMTSPALGGLPTEHCVSISQATTASRIGDAVAAAGRDATDMLFVYYSGHGLPGLRSSELFLTLPDTTPDRPAFSGISYDALRDEVLNSPAVLRVLVLDCCFSGRATAPYLSGVDTLQTQLHIDGTCVLTASPANRVALVGSTYSEFTGALLEVLRCGISEEGPLLSVGAIYRCLRKNMVAQGLPAPQMLTTATAGLFALTPNLAYIANAAPAAAEPKPITGRIFASGPLAPRAVPALREQPVAPEYSSPLYLAPVSLSYEEGSGVSDYQRSKNDALVNDMLRRERAREALKSAEKKFAAYMHEVADFCLGPPAEQQEWEYRDLLPQHEQWSHLIDKAEAADSIEDIRKATGAVDLFLRTTYRTLPWPPEFGSVGGFRRMAELKSVHRLLVWRIRRRMDDRRKELHAYLLGIAHFCEPPIAIAESITQELAQRIPELADPIIDLMSLLAESDSIDQQRLKTPAELASHLDGILTRITAITEHIDMRLRALVEEGLI
ncbi:caspase family protein [Nocardia brasiliensis]|uniref:caspase family protein n=1 Tax=Nocardia brasiliensis TaxID=37326 RepID=UPI002458729B|nr:caspase family protein [Nocardia brasiliensis]